MRSASSIFYDTLSSTLFYCYYITDTSQVQIPCCDFGAVHSKYTDFDILKYIKNFFDILKSVYFEGITPKSQQRIQVLISLSK